MEAELSGSTYTTIELYSYFNRKLLSLLLARRTCEQCSTLFDDEAQLQSHLCSSKSGGDDGGRKLRDAKRSYLRHRKHTFKCDECCFKVSCKSELARHKLVQSDERKFSCHLCSHKAKSKGRLKKHALIHSDIYAFKCDLCSYKAKRKGDLRKHALTHVDVSEFKCDLCSYNAKFICNLRNHALTHVLYAFKCDLCSYKAKSKKILINIS